MKIKKIYIQNFKGIYKKTVIDLETQPFTILSGPNGFGKTTIFDVIELCLSGKLQRSVTYSNVTKHNADYKKPFYQNHRDEDVVVKLWLAIAEADHIIIKRLNKTGDGRIDRGKAFRPDSWQLLETYYTDDSSGFDANLDLSGVRRVNQAFIDELLYPAAGVSLENLFPLFHYLQQEENIYFLKKDEERKKTELNFLFQTQEQSQDLDRATALASRLNNLKGALSGRIHELGQVVGDGRGAPYQRVVLSRRYPWDGEDPFAGISPEQLNLTYDTYRRQLTDLVAFARNFDVSEFNRFRLRNRLQEIIRGNWSLSSIILQSFLSPESIEQLQNQHRLNDRYKGYRAALSDFSFDEAIVTELGFARSQAQSMAEGFELRRELKTQQSMVGKIIEDLNDARLRSYGRFLELFEVEHLHEPVNCPLCNSKWNTIPELDTAVSNKTVEFQALLGAQETSLGALERELFATYVEPLRLAIDKYLAMPEHAIEDAFYADVIQRQGNLKATNEVVVFLTANNIAISDLQAQSYQQRTEVTRRVELLSKRLQDMVASLTIDESRIENRQMFIELYGEDPTRIISEGALEQKLTYITERFNQAKLTAIRVLGQRLVSVSQLHDQIAEVRNRLSSAIFEYKRAMIEKIKIPFYIYSGKILQHFQQGYGVFIDVSSTTSRVRFLADESSDHDIIHQLSTGQLAVVSIAFCLSLNKVYELPSQFKFLAIDDPVQTLDDLNIYSFIDLIRHEFDDYQIIISTHDENVSNFLSYKFEKFGISNKKLNVQTVFYASQQG